MVLRIDGVIGTLWSADGLDFASPCTILRIMKDDVGSSWPNTLCQYAMAEMFVATVAGDAQMGGETRLEMNRAIVDDNAGKGGILYTDLQKTENLSHAFWY